MRIQTKQKSTNFAQNDQTLKIYKEKEKEAELLLLLRICGKDGRLTIAGRDENE